MIIRGVTLGQGEAEALDARVRFQVAAEGLDPAGEALWRQCASCHQIGEGATNRTGPMLNNTYGAPVGSHEGFRYSPAFAEANAAGIVWDDETLAAYLLDPRGFIPGNRNFEEPDERTAGIRVASEVVRATPELVLCNAAGFGGTNSCLVLRVGR